MIRFVYVFFLVKFYSNSLTSVKIALVKSHGIVTNCLNAGLIEILSSVCVTQLDAVLSV